MVDRVEGPERQLKIDLVERELLRMIDSGELRPGEALQQRDIAKRLDVSPTPVREAFRRLEMAGILVTTSHSGVRVADPFDPLDEASRQVRSALEQVGLELAIKTVTSEDIARLRGLNEAYRSAPSAEAVDLHWKLHLGIIELARSRVLTTHLRMMWNLLNLSNAPPRSRADSAAHHEEIIAAIAARDADGAKRLMDEHHNHRVARG